MEQGIEALGLSKVPAELRCGEGRFRFLDHLRDLSLREKRRILS